MGACFACSGPLAAGQRYCPACGTPAASETPTGTAPRAGSRSPAAASARPTPASGPGRLSTSTPADERFAPGTLVAARYRVAGLIGRGGMGEVYRADDLVLGQAVALKFLPEQVAHDPERLARFYNEVRLAREITHPAVCRVHDVAELDGQPFLSMEYVDGENLASLLRRIGRLPADKALELARQVCAGLAAAHDKGVLHRDLKPENVMIDGRGRARITDFGLAAAAEDVSGAEVRSGTPAYMAPEQLAGREVSARSDVYALGLVLFELFTGRRVFEGRTRAELTRQHLEHLPPRPSQLVPDIEPAVERVVLRCLEKDPARRPASALAVSAALPGGDPLAAALAAGETPSPQMVAAAGSAGGLRPAAAATLAATALAATLGTLVVTRGTSLAHLAPFDKSPAVLEDRARELLRQLAPGAPAADRAAGLSADVDYLYYLAAQDSSPGRWNALRTGRPPGAAFWYRESPRPLVALERIGIVTWSSPPPDRTGMAGVALDLQGRLHEFYRVPPQLETPAEPARASDWSRLLALAGLSEDRLEPAQPRWTPPFFCDARAAWTGTYAEAPATPIRVEAAAYRGQPVYFAVLGDWTRPVRMQPFESSAGEAAANRIGATLLVLVLLAAGLLARRNLHLGRGDRGGALRVAAVSFVTLLAAWLLRAHHVAEFGFELLLLLRASGVALAVGAILWTLYVALEPQVRRHWPHVLIGWTRLLAGGWRDPLVGRDVLMGTLAGALAALLMALAGRLPAWLGAPATLPSWYRLEVVLGLRHVLPAYAEQAVEALALALGLLLMMMLLRLLLRRGWLAAAVVVLLLSVQLALGEFVGAWSVLPLLVLGWAIPLALLLRVGLLAHAACVLVMMLLLNHPLTLDLGHWTATPTLLVLALLAALALYGYHVARAGRALFEDRPQPR